ncbi:hypothetical protein QFW96_06925 [Saccharopolyspora sp. TS4A08]|uniref:Acyl-CoA carboxylase subunit epsilon n=1 Tax=Saccharopolyspora ipomoeae TaxID=3042027 RepID=A0ABT6PKG4_9PSEU|nr:hypothetical protein [Saccharopolyspora sp. TS4A08]MDI2028335.1 hypothetical protein [Saccharopolyspora sp. TS4A08]
MAQQEFQGSDAPTPPRGMPVIDPQADLDTPPEGLHSLGDVISAQDVGPATPSVIGEPEPERPRDDAGDWPTLQYRRRQRDEKPRRNPLDFFRRDS